MPVVPPPPPPPDVPDRVPPTPPPVAPAAAPTRPPSAGFPPPPPVPQYGTAFPPQPTALAAGRPEWLNARVGVLAIALLAVVAGLGVTAVLTTRDEPPPSLTVGTCFDAISPEYTGPAVFLRAPQHRIVSCDGPHLAEVIHSYVLDPDATGPPDPVQPPEGYELPCVVGASASVLGDAAAELSVSPLLPTAAGWAAGHREVLCAVTSSPGPVAMALPPGSFVDQAADSPPTTEPATTTTEAPEGRCFDDRGRLADCDEPHRGEVFLVIELPNGSTSEQEAFYRCVEATDDRQFLRPIDGLDIHAELDDGPSNGPRYATCSVQAPPGEPQLVGSLLR